MSHPLENIATIKTGIYEKPNPMGSINYIRGNLINHQYELTTLNSIPKLMADENLQHHLLQDKDILFMAKGERNAATLFNSSFGESVASSIFFVIRLFNRNILPEYLAWYLNYMYETGRTKQLVKGSNIPSISKKSLEKLEIPIPSLEIQKRILRLVRLWEKEKELTRNLLNKKELYYQNLLNRIANQ